ncbi:hypothetical protein GCM10022393_39880 [Aquimarina addita]|uniref:Uncharacterized protein n=1 Tax=Aquimarina addita TaxID=870485 RepID=A0ABP6UT23_9FLAO
MDLIRHIIKIKANESKSFNSIEIDRFDGSFCSNQSYEINIDYKPTILFDTELINSLKNSYDPITKETKKLNNLLYHYASAYRSSEKDHFKKLNELLIKILKMQSLNEKKFTTNSVIASEKQ